MITLTVNNEPITVEDGCTLATAIFASGAIAFRRSVSGQSRAPLCGMGICFECRVSINGVKHQRSCLAAAVEGMVIETDE